MVLFTHLSPHECVNRLSHLGGDDPKCRQVAGNRKYRFPNGDWRLVVIVGGVDFDIEIWGRGKYSSDVLVRFSGTVETHTQTGGSIIKGSFVRTQFALVAMIVCGLFAAFPWLMMMLATLLGKSPDLPSQSWFAQYYGMAAAAGSLILYGLWRSRRLVTSFLRELLEAKAKVN